MDPGYVAMKVVVVGDGAVGKTSMLLCYTTNTFPTDYMPTVFDNYAVNVPYGDKVVNLGLWDTAGQEEYAQYRPLSYDAADGFILCFSIISRSSYENVAARWIKELRDKAAKTPIILVGTKLDLRDNETFVAEHPEAQFVTTEMGQDMANRIGAARYVECSALTQENLKQVFESAIEVHMNPPAQEEEPEPSGGCLSCCFGGGGGKKDGGSGTGTAIGIAGATTQV